MKERRELSLHSRSALSVAVLAVLSNAPAAHAQTTDTWTAGKSGLWNVASDWSAGVPNDGAPTGTTYNVDIVDGKSTVTLNINATINDLSIGAGNTLAIEGNQVLSVLGPSIANSGSIQVNGGNGTNTYLQLAGSVNLSGTGTLTLSTATGGGSAFIQPNGQEATLNNAGTIQGTGVIGNGNGGLIVNNTGVIDANTAAGTGILVLNGYATTNTGTLEATGGGTLAVQTNTTNYGGTIAATGKGSSVSLDGISIYGGTLATSAGGALQSSGTNSLNDVTLASGTVYPIANSVTNLYGSFTNNGSVQISGGNGVNSYLGIGNSLTSNGPITLSTATATGGGAAFIQPNGVAVTLTNTSTIQGSGVIGNGNGGLTLDNATTGIVDANATGAGLSKQLTLNGYDTINSGLLEATNGNTLAIQTNVENTGGSITASGAGSIVDLAGVTVRGGTLATTGGGAIQSSGTNQLYDVTIASGTTYPISNSNTQIYGRLTNDGNIQITGGNGVNSYLGIGNSLTSNGPITLATAAGGGAAFIQPNGSNVTLTNTSTIQGTGVIGNGNGGLIVNNTGVIDANTAAGTGILVLNGYATTNTGTLEATGGGTLAVQTNTTNYGGTIAATGKGSSVSLDGISIYGGTLATSAGGALQSSGTNSLNDVTLASGTVYPIANSVTNLYGSFTNNGSVQISGGNGVNSYLGIGNSLTSNGPITLSTATATGGGAAFIQPNGVAVTLTNTSTIQGSGVIGNGNGGLTLDNATTGIVDANATGAGLSKQLTLNGYDTINSGLLEATNGNTLAIQTNVENTGGSITASGAGSIVDLAGVTVRGGTLATTGGGAIQSSGTNQLYDVTLASGTTYPISNSATQIYGTLTNDGNIQITGGNGVNSYLSIGNSLTQAGSITLSTGTANGGGAAFIQPNGSAVIFTNAGTIQGAGVIGNGNGGLTLVNAPTGIIDSNASGKGLSTSLVLNGYSFTNLGTLAVGSGNLLQVTSGFTNFVTGTLTGGSYDTAGKLEIDALGNAGGEIVTNAGGISLNGATATFVDAGGKSVLTNLASNTTAGSFTVTGGANFTTAGNFTNNGTLGAGAGSTFTVNGNLGNFSGTTLTGGTYAVGGTLKFKGANVVTDDAAIALTSSTGEIVNSTNGANGLANLATIGATGSFSVSGGASFKSVGAFSNAGAFSVGAGSSFTTGGTTAFTQSGGSLADNGTLAAAGGVALTAGTLVGSGSITGNLQSSGSVTPGVTGAPGTLTDTGTYTQKAGGSLNIGIGGATSFDALKSTTAVLGGTLNISELGGFVPTVGSTFKIVDFGSATGTFATVNGLAINGSEKFTLTYQPTDVLLTVVSVAPIDRPPGIATPREGTMHVARLVATDDDASRLSATLREFNTAYAVGGTQALGRDSAFMRISKSQRHDGLDLVRKRGR